MSRILTAAWGVLARSRFRSLKIRQVLVASQTSASNFYRHFPSKAHLLLALLREEADRARHHLAEQMAAADDAEAQLRVWLAFHVGALFHESRVERVRLFRDQALLEELPEEVRGVQQVLHELLVETIRRGVEEGAFRTEDPAGDAEVVHCIVRGLLADGAAGLIGGAEEQVLERLHKFVLRALRAETLAGAAGATRGSLMLAARRHA